MAADSGSVAAATVAIGQSVAAYSYFLPTLREVRQADRDDPTMRGDVLLGQVASGSVSVSIGVMLAWLTGSQVPVYVSILVAAIIASIYQFALNSNHALESK